MSDGWELEKLVHSATSTNRFTVGRTPLDSHILVGRRLTVNYSEAYNCCVTAGTGSNICMLSSCKTVTAMWQVTAWHLRTKTCSLSGQCQTETFFGQQSCVRSPCIIDAVATGCSGNGWLRWTDVDDGRMWPETRQPTDSLTLLLLILFMPHG